MSDSMNDLAGCSILVVDDTEANLDILVAALGDTYDVSVAMDGETALEDVAENPPDLILLDIMMPGIDGYEVLERVRKQRTADDLPIIMATALGESEDIVKALKLGANDYVTKPFDLPVVLARVETQLSLKISRAALAAAHQRMKRDLEAASRIQRTFLPPDDLTVAGARLSWRFLPCDELAGDTLNILPLDEGHVGLFMVDVSGHGVPSALLSVTLSRLMSRGSEASSMLWRHDEGSSGPRIASPAEVAGELAQRFPFDEESRLYFTLLYGVLDLEQRELRYVSAGHPALVHLRRGSQPTYYGSSAPPIGLLPAELAPAEYEEVTVPLEEGDRLYGYSDGIPEAHDPGGEELGQERVAAELGRRGGRSLDESVASLLEYVQQWSGSRGLEDDVSVLAVEIGS
jgi:sigma-B regulation protein RsbU (phosphoserine phosphatase)